MRTLFLKPIISNPRRKIHRPAVILSKNETSGIAGNAMIWALFGQAAGRNSHFWTMRRLENAAEIAVGWGFFPHIAQKWDTAVLRPLAEPAYSFIFPFIIGVFTWLSALASPLLCKSGSVEESP